MCAGGVTCFAPLLYSPNTRRRVHISRHFVYFHCHGFHVHFGSRRVKKKLFKKRIARRIHRKMRHWKMNHWEYEFVSGAATPCVEHRLCLAWFLRNMFVDNIFLRSKKCLFNRSLLAISKEREFSIPRENHNERKQTINSKTRLTFYVCVWTNESNTMTYGNYGLADMFWGKLYSKSSLISIRWNYVVW